MFGDSRKQHICGIATELFKERRDIKVLDAGAGTGNVGQMVSYLSDGLPFIMVLRRETDQTRPYLKTSRETVLFLHSCGDGYDCRGRKTILH